MGVGAGLDSWGGGQGVGAGGRGSGGWDLGMGRAERVRMVGTRVAGLGWLDGCWGGGFSYDL